MRSDKKRRKKFQKKERLRSILYYIYPKTKDIQKTFMFIMGAALGLIIYTRVLLPDKDALWKLIYTFVTFELLLYAARYQINDIRGAWEDTEDMHRTGLPLISKNNSFNIGLSLAIAGIKFGGAIGMIGFLFWNKDPSALPLAVIAILIIISTVLYEKARSSVKYRYLIIPFVGMGYPLRFLAGLLTMLPRFFMVCWPWCICLCAAYYFYGITAATLPWAWEALENESKKYSAVIVNRDNLSNGTPDPVLRYLLNECTWVIDDHCKSAHAVEGIIPKKTPDRQKLSGWWMPWNAAYVTTTIFMGLALMPNIINNPLWILIVALMLIAVMEQTTNGVFSRLLALISYIFPVAIWLICGRGGNLLVIYLCLTQIVFMGTYHYLLFVFDPTYNFIQALIGPQTVVWMKKKQRQSTESLSDIIKGEGPEDEKDNGAS